MRATVTTLNLTGAFGNMQSGRVANWDAARGRASLDGGGLAGGGSGRVGGGGSQESWPECQCSVSEQLNASLDTSEDVMITNLPRTNVDRLSSFARLQKISPAGLAWLTMALLIFAMTATAGAEQSFKTAAEAADALLKAVKSGDQKGVLAVLGPDGAGIASSGDGVEDAAARKQFTDAYDAKHQINMEGDQKAVLVIGDQDWPFPIPIIRKDDRWHFDTATGREEILDRRIGRDELPAIQACLAYVDAQNDYANLTRANTGAAAYAQRIVSLPGRKDGLYWPTEPGENLSPLGELVASATSEGYHVGGGRAPFHGYYYKILNRQGPAAPGGAYDYVVHGKMIGGFALVAYPAVYRNSGVMTFLVNHEGTVFEKDLGLHTANIAEHMTSFNPDDTWKKVTVEAPEQ
jgi:hypothetical protein